VGSIKHLLSCETQMYLYVFSHTKITLLRTFVTRQLTLTCTWGRKYLKAYKPSPNSELCVIENIVTHCYYWRAVNVLTNGPSYAGVYRTANQQARISVLCHRQQRTVQRVSTHSRQNLRMQLQPAAIAYAQSLKDLWYQKPENCSGNTVPLHRAELPLLAA
jgi:hypothetical protein